MNEDMIIKKLLEHDDQFKEIRAAMATKEDIQDIKNTLDSIVSIVNKIKEDQVFAIEWMKRLQHQVDEQQKVIDRQTEEIKVIKLKLGLV